MRPRLDDGLEWERLYTDGDDACELSKAYGLTPDPWQAAIVKDWMRRLPDERYAATSCGVSVPRQNGKNSCLEMREFTGLVMLGESILHTAHRVDTARKSFLRLVSFFENPQYPELQELVVHIRKTNGQEGIQLNNGGCIEFSSRVNGGKRGATYDVVVFDEAQELTDDQMEAIMSTMSASPSGCRQLIYTGTPPSPVSPGTIFARKRKGALDGSDLKILWHEWSVGEVGDVTDRDRWYATNPALGIRLDEDFTQEECNTLSEMGFARERLGWWESRTANRAISDEAWDQSGIPAGDVPGSGRKAFGVKLSPDGECVALSVCVIPEEGPAHVELVDTAPLCAGLSWVSEYLCEASRAESTAAVAVDGKNGAAALVDALLDSYPKKALMSPGVQGVIDASSMFLDALRCGGITHWADEAQAVLDMSAQSPKRPIGHDGGWGFGGAFPAPIESAAIAYWAAKTTKRDPEGGCVLL